MDYLPRFLIVVSHVFVQSNTNAKYHWARFLRTATKHDVSIGFTPEPNMSIQWGEEVRSKGIFCENEDCKYMFGESLVQPMKGERFECPFVFWSTICEGFVSDAQQNYRCYNVSTDLSQFQRDVNEYYAGDGLPPWRPAKGILDLVKAAPRGIKSILHQCHGARAMASLLWFELSLYVNSETEKKGLESTCRRQIIS